MDRKKTKSERLHAREVTTEFELRDKHGKIKPLWNETRLGQYLRTRYGVIARIPWIMGSYAPVLRTHNLISNIGHAGANGRMSNQGSYSPFINLALGIGAETANALDQALSSEITTNGGARAAGTASQVTTTITNDTTQLVHTWAFTGSFSITEEGIFDSATAPTVTTTTQSRINTDTTVTVASGTGITNNDFLQWENEIVQVTSGGGTGTLTITRAQKGTTAASHASGTGLVDINTSANMLAKQTFLALPVASGDSLQVTHKYQT